MKKIPPRLLILIAIVLSLLAAFLAYKMMAKKKPTTTVAVEKNIPIVLAKANIAPETIIKEEMLKVVNVPKEAAQPDTFRDVKSVVGRKTVQAINAGDQLTRRRFSAMPNTGLQVSIPKDKRAVTIPIDEVSSVAGFVKPGQYVDVINVVGAGKGIPTTGKMILQNVLVLGTGARDMSSAGSTKAEKFPNVTLAVDPRDAVKLRVAQQEGGKISLALRPLKPEEDEVMGTLVVGSGAAYMPKPATPPITPQCQKRSQGLLLLEELAWVPHRLPQSKL